MALIILVIGLLVFAGHFLTGFFERTKVPDVLVLMLAGILLGPVLHVVDPSDFGQVGPVFTTMALIVILFEGGIHLNLKTLWAAAKETVTISLATFVITVPIIALVADLALPLEFPSPLLIGTILGGTSAAVVVPLVRVLHMAERPATVLFLESALTDVLTVVITLGLLEGFASGNVITMQSFAAAVAGSFLVAALVGLVGAFLWSAILDKVRQFPNTVFTTIAYVCILYGLSELWGYSGAIAALTFGIAVANFPNIPERVLGKVISFRLVGFTPVERAFFSEAVFLIKTFFFVYLGLSIAFRNLGAVATGLALALVAVVARLIVIRVLAPRRTSRRDAMLMTALVPKGLAAAVLAAILVQRGVPNSDIAQATIYAVILFSITISAALVFVVERGALDRVGARVFAPFSEREIALGAPVAAEAAEPFAHSLGLPPITRGFEEPNPIDLREERAPEAERPDTAPSETDDERTTGRPSSDRPE